MQIFEAKAGQPLTILFTQLDPSGQNLVTGLAGVIAKSMRDEDGDAGITVTITEQGTSGYYEATFTLTKSRDTGHTHLLRLVSPAGITDESILEFTIRCFPSITVSQVTGAFLTTLANLKEFAGITGVGNDALLTNLIARLSRMIEGKLGRKIVEASYQEIRNGGGRMLTLYQWPVSVFTNLYVSQDQLWDATTIVPAADYVVDKARGVVFLKNSFFYDYPQSIRCDYTAGYAQIPLEVEQYAIEKITELYQQKSILGITTMTLKDGSFTRAASRKEVLSDIYSALPQYVARRV